jgi:glycerol uptake facilitator-like aquaporin
LQSFFRGTFNPANAFAFYSAGTLPSSDLLPYILVETLGSLAAFEAYKRIVNKS